jgi:hypothetical protein
MELPKELLVADLRHGAPPTLDAVADALLQMAVHDDAISQDEATELLNWDLLTIAEYLALKLQEDGALTADDVHHILTVHNPGICH